MHTKSENKHGAKMRSISPVRPPKVVGCVPFENRGTPSTFQKDAIIAENVLLIDDDTGVHLTQKSKVVLSESSHRGTDYADYAGWFLFRSTCT